MMILQETREEEKRLLVAKKVVGHALIEKVHAARSYRWEGFRQTTLHVLLLIFLTRHEEQTYNSFTTKKCEICESNVPMLLVCWQT
jgi:hypothetical protein